MSSYSSGGLNFRKTKQLFAKLFLSIPLFTEFSKILFFTDLFSIFFSSLRAKKKDFFLVFSRCFSTSSSTSFPDFLASSNRFWFVLFVFSVSDSFSYSEIISPISSSSFSSSFSVSFSFSLSLLFSLLFSVNVTTVKIFCKIKFSHKFFAERRPAIKKKKSNKKKNVKNREINVFWVNFGYMYRNQFIKIIWKSCDFKLRKDIINKTKRLK